MWMRCSRPRLRQTTGSGCAAWTYRPTVGELVQHPQTLDAPLFGLGPFCGRPLLELQVLDQVGPYRPPRLHLARVAHAARDSTAAIAEFAVVSAAGVPFTAGVLPAVRGDVARAELDVLVRATPDHQLPPHSSYLFSPTTVPP